MISISGKHWSEKKIDKNLVEKLAQKENFSQILSKLIISRQFDDEEIYSINNEIEITNVFKLVISFRLSNEYLNLSKKFILSDLSF